MLFPCALNSNSYPEPFPGLLSYFSAPEPGCSNFTSANTKPSRSDEPEERPRSRWFLNRHVEERVQRTLCRPLHPSAPALLLKYQEQFLFFSRRGVQVAVGSGSDAAGEGLRVLPGLQVGCSIWKDAPRPHRVLLLPLYSHSHLSPNAGSWPQASPE